MVTAKWQIGDWVAMRMQQLGVEDYFVVPGDFNLDFLDQLLRYPQLRMINCCNELNAGYAADGYARTSASGIAVVVVTYMVGSLSLLNAIAGAYSAGLRVIVLCGGPPSTVYSSPTIVHHSLGLADKGQSLRIYEQVTCQAIRIGSDCPWEEIDRTLDDCLRHRRPVYIEVPVDIANLRFDKPVSPERCLANLRSIKPEDSLENATTAGAIEAIQDCWSSAKCPVIILGGGIRSVLSVQMIDRLVSTLGCAAFYLLDGKSLISESHPQCGGLFWTIVSDPGVEDTVVRDADLWVTIGCQWNDLHTLKSVDVCQEAGRILAIERTVVRTPHGRVIPNTPIAGLVEGLVASSSIYQKPASMTCLQRNRMPSPASSVSSKSITVTNSHVPLPLTVDDIVAGITSVVTSQDTVFADAGESWFTASQVRLPSGADFQTQLLYSSTGWSLPAAMGCQLAKKKETHGRTILVIGDGSMQMTAQEISTMIRYRTPAVIFVINNYGYQIEEAIHCGPYNQIGGWDYTAFAESLQDINSNNSKNIDGPFRLVTAKVKTQDDLTTALAQLRRAHQELVLVECCVDPTRASAPMKKFGAKLVTRAGPQGIAVPGERDAGSTVSL
ncbi:pyruvate decarboxylase [Aspergillus fijiensis CBS 313.89]|uniref:Pyruvate decarboxylase n=1 Tax=Aspergillus fijiensis CBS 313.89 TaxID=1448319 RepID=A0A8G1RM48_9EURO|nr:pyruvate decarboxylase [Aspergillus fijiensis CBS 313.89]RAK76582.1 pyruvate decarboxylase [Aspergillus fijiensis CBS 313.89]